MLIIEIYFFLFYLSCIDSQRYYAFIETLFIIDRNYFPPLTYISYEEYIRTMVDTANIIFQTENDFDIKIEIILSKIIYLNIVQPQSQEPDLYESILRNHILDYDRYDSIVLLWYQPWEGSYSAQGYAKVKGICHPSYKIMYLLPYQNAAFYLAHEFGHQFGFVHQIDTSCFTKSYMSVMTKSHTASYERARWTRCENNFFNENICQFQCLFNKPNDYKPIKNKYATLPGKHMNNDQQAKMIEPNSLNIGEVSSYTYMSSDLLSRCLYFRYYTGGLSNENKFAYSPMLPGSTCGDNCICHRDECTSMNDLDSSLFNIEYDTEILDLTTYCSSNSDRNQLLKDSNRDPHNHIECIDWENDFLCQQTQSCPKENDISTSALYIRHICCKKCSLEPDLVIHIFSQARTNKNSSIFIRIIFLVVIFFS